MSIKGQRERAQRAKEGKCKYLVHVCIAGSVIKARISYNYHPGSCAAQFSVVKRAKGDYMWDAGPKVSKHKKPQNPGCFLLQISLHSLGSSLSQHIHNAAIHTCVTQSVVYVFSF